MRSYRMLLFSTTYSDPITTPKPPHFPHCVSPFIFSWLVEI